MKNIKDRVKVNAKILVLTSFLIPALIILVIFQLIPTIWTIWIGFTDMALVGKKFLHYNFIGLKNYIKALSDSYFWISMKVTLYYCLASLALRFLLGLAAAFYITSKAFKGKGIMAAIFLLPYIIPGTIHSYVWLSMLEPDYGTVNRALRALNLPPQSWTYERLTESIIAVNCWAGYALAMLVLASALTSIPKEYYEISDIYGASRWFKFRKITLPLIKYPLILTLILIFKEDIDDFTYAYMFTGETPYPDYKTELISLYAYHKAFSDFELGFGCAVGFIIAVIVFVLTLFQLKISEVRR